MAMADRPASFLPTIKCSSCGKEIEISLMGEHVCSGPDAGSEEPASFADQADPYDSNDYNNISISSNPYDDAPSNYNKRTEPSHIPPQVDTSAANRNYNRPGQLTPVSNSSDSQSVSPRTPPFTGRSYRAPSNAGGDYFEPAIAEYDSPSQRRPSGYGDESGSNGSNGPFKPIQRTNTAPYAPSRLLSNASSRNAFRTDSFDAPVLNRAGTFPRVSQHNNNDLGVRMPTAPLRLSERPRLSDASAYDINESDNPYRNTNSRMGPPPASSLLQPGARPAPLRTGQLRPRTASSRSSVSSSVSSSVGSSFSSSNPPTSMADEFGIGNPYHASHESMSSNVSSLSAASSSQGGPYLSTQSSFSSAFSASSFSTNASSQQPPRHAASKSRGAADLDGVLQDLQALKTSNSSSSNNNNNSIDRGLPSPRMPSPQTPAMALPPSTPIDARFQQRRPSAERPMEQPNERTRVGSNSNNNNSNMYPRSPAPVPASPAPPATPASSRGNCKACRDPITGKSVSSADGRLTGRYHKACFVCTTCAAPFTSATFYVHSDMPYCERHYHEVNGSLCGTCGNGIEGPYLADEADCKHHRLCFVCGDCSRPLEDGYFEVGGKVYCERDAWRRVQQQQQQQQQQYLPPRAGNNSAGRNMGRGGNNMAPPRGLPAGPGMPRPPVIRGMEMNINNSNNGFGGPRPPPMGLPSGNRLAPPRLRMEKRMTRMGMF